MTAEHKTQTSYVDLGKACAKIRNYPGAGIDRKVFHIIANDANDKGVVQLTTHMGSLLYEAVGIEGLSVSFCRIANKGLIKEASYDLDEFGYPHGTITIASDYMLHTEPSDDTERIQNIEKRLNNLTKVFANDDSEKKIVKLENRIEKLEYDNKRLREIVKDCVGKLEEPIADLANRQSLKINLQLEELIYRL